MKEDFVTYKQAVALKKLGFDEECIGYYDNEGEFTYNQYWTDEPVKPSDLYKSFNWNTSSKIYNAPTLSQVQRYLRDKKNLSIEVYSLSKTQWSREIINLDIERNVKISESKFNTYEEALSKGIDECLELLEAEKSSIT